MKNLKVAFIFGKGIDGAGVTVFATEHKKWLEKNGHTCDLYNFKHKHTYFRAQNYKDLFIDFDINEMIDTFKKINEEYDIVILNSYPSKRINPDDTRAMFMAYSRIIKNPIKVAMQHEIKKGNYNRIPALPLWYWGSDQIVTFSRDVDFVKNMKEVIPHMDDRIYGYTIPIDIDNLTEWYNRSVEYDWNKKLDRLAYLSRWTTMKQPQRVLNMKKVADDEGLVFNGILRGIDKSIGARHDILNHEKAQVLINAKDVREFGPEENNDLIPIYGPYERSEGFQYMIENKTVCNFYRLKEKDKHNYGNRMEYAQMEMAAITVPVFDLHWGLNNYDKSGTPFAEIPYSAIYIDENNLEGGIKSLQKIWNDKNLWMKYKERSFKTISDNYDSNYVIPEFYEKIIKEGKYDKQIKFKEYCDKFNSKIDLFEQFKDGKLPVIQFNKIDKNSEYFWDVNKIKIIDK